MIRDARDVSAGTTIQCDICIIGAGPAGISLALSLPSRLSVCLLESGGVEPSSEASLLNQGRVHGWLANSGAYLSNTRCRALGGATNLWSGTCGALLDEDFEPRPWLGYSGWPIRYEDVKPYYTRAMQFCGIPAAHLESRRGKAVFSVDPQEFSPRHFFKATVGNFGSRYRQELKSSTVQVLLNATVLELVQGDHERSVRSVRIGVMPGKEFSLEAGQFVLAAGAIENARLLLTSKGASPNGIGNSSGHVGRYFMEHPYISIGSLYTSDVSSMEQWENPQGKSADTRGFSALCTTRAAQAKSGRPEVRYHIRSVGAPKDLSLSHPIDANFTERLLLAKDEPINTPVRWASFSCALETEPLEASRVVVVQEKDAFGIQRIELSSELSNRDCANFTKTTLRVMSQIAGSLRTRIRVSPDLIEEIRNGHLNSNHCRPGGHHLGTTRMAPTEREGVVDRDCKVFECSNLFVAGSSVFPIASTVNPTLSIVALAVRLADHLTGIERCSR